ncbi:unnamed protein product [Ectocarpus sp. 12 AP-2014]
MMAKVGVANSKEGAVLQRSHTFVIEIDRQGAPEQERLRWRWRDSLGDNTASVAQELLSFLQNHFQAPAGSTPTTATPAGERASGDQQDVDSYSVQVYDPARGGWAPLSVSTPSETIPRNCRVRVNVSAKPQATATRCRRTTTKDPYFSDGNSCKHLSASLPSGQARTSAPFDGTAVPGAATTVDGIPLPDDESSLDSLAPGEMLALPWRRFDKDLGGEGEEGLKICGSRVAIRDVSNSSEGTGLFTWDGAVLLAKYLEHRAVAMRRDFREQQPCHSSQPSCRHPEGTGDGSSVAVAAGDSADVNVNSNSSIDCRSSNSNISISSISSCSKSVRAAPVRVLELGCGTGLAGLAAAFAFGRRNSSTSGDDNGEVNPPPLSPCRRGNPLEGENDEGVAQCASPPAQVAVVLTDLEYALTNARANISLNSSSLEAVGAEVSSMELDWCRPLPSELSDKEAFHLILAADVVWLDDLVTPLVRTLERLTAGWPGGGVDASPAPLPPAPADGTQEEPRNETGLAAGSGSGATPQECDRGGCAVRSVGRPRPPAGRRVLLAYQWRSERTGRALLEELGACFRVREIPPEECHPDYLPSTNLCLLEAVRRQEWQS